MPVLVGITLMYSKRLASGVLESVMPEVDPDNVLEAVQSLPEGLQYLILQLQVEHASIALRAWCFRGPRCTAVACLEQKLLPHSTAPHCLGGLLRCAGDIGSA